MGRLLDNCKDGRFQRVERRLFRSLGYFLRHGTIGCAKVTDITHRAKTWKSTFYDHFKDKDDAIEKYNHRFDKEIKKLFTELSSEPGDTELAFYRLLYFIGKNKEYYKTFLQLQNPLPFFTMAKYFRSSLAHTWSNYGRDKYDLGFKIFCGEMFGIIYFWGDTEKFDRAKIKGHATYLSNLARNTTRRLF